MSLYSIGKPEGIELREGFFLVRNLLKRFDTEAGAAAREWEYPMSREALIAADQWDAFLAANSKPNNRATYPRPFAVKEAAKEMLKPKKPATKKQFDEMLARRKAAQEAANQAAAETTTTEETTTEGA